MFKNLKILKGNRNKLNPMYQKMRVNPEFNHKRKRSKLRMKCMTAFYKNGVLILLPGRLVVTKIRNVAFVFCLFILFVTLISLYLLNSPSDWTSTRHLDPKLPETFMDLCTESSLLENTCRIPWIYKEEKDIKRWIDHFGPISCTKQSPNLAFLDEQNVLTIQKDLDANWDLFNLPFNCNISKLTGGLKPKPYKYFMEDIGITLGLNEKLKVEHDQFVVTCFNRSKGLLENGTFPDYVIYERAFAGFANQEQKKLRAPKSSVDNPSIIVLVLDSTSRNQFIRHAPLSMEYMEQLGFITMNGYTKVGDNSGVNLFPVLAGRTSEKMEGTGKELVEKLPVQAEQIEFLWDLMRKKGCVTMINDDVMSNQRGLFAYHHHDGFKKPPTDYYFRPFSIFNVKKEVDKMMGQCNIHGQSLLNQHFGLLERMSRVFKEHCHFSLTFLPTPTHDNPSQLETEDVEIRSILEKFYATGVLNNTVVAIMGDHGNRIGGIQWSYTGRIEERMPLFSLYLPSNLHQKYPNFRKNLEYNTNRLVSNYDIYKTFREIALMGQKEKQVEQIPYRGYSLLTQKVPANLSCLDAGIPNNFCTCLEDKALPRYKRDEDKYYEILTEINDHLENNFKSCLKMDTLVFESEEIRALSVNPMIRQGWRKMNATRKLEYKSFMEVIYHDINANVTSVLNESLQLLVRVKNYVRDKNYRIPHIPLIINPQNATEFACNRNNLRDYCKNVVLPLMS